MSANDRRLSRLLPALAALLLLASGCDYARMTDDEAVNTYGRKMPAAPEHTVPVNGGIEELKSRDPNSLRNPLAATPPAIVQGRTAYGYYCGHCHGALADGHGTVGQSFSPLPSDLRAASVQSQSDGQLFAKTSLGFKRCPPLALTVAETERWAIINYLRTLAVAPRP